MAESGGVLSFPCTSTLWRVILRQSGIWPKNARSVGAYLPMFGQADGFLFELN